MIIAPKYNKLLALLDSCTPFLSALFSYYFTGSFGIIGLTDSTIAK